jgi:hypothetical protein
MRPGLPVIVDRWQPVTTWLHEPPPRSGESYLKIILPNPGARIERVSLAQGQVVVETHATNAVSPGLELRAVAESHGLTTEVETSCDDQTWSGRLDTIPDRLHVFLLDANQQVCDWCTIDPMRHPRPVGIDVEFPIAKTENLLDGGETNKVEFKPDVTTKNRDDFLESVVAFANTEGGTILVGVSNNGVALGLADSETTRARAEHWCNTLVDPRPEVRISTQRIRDADLLVIEVEAGPNQPYMATPAGHCYIRRGASDYPMSRPELLAAIKTGAAGGLRHFRGTP